MTSEQIKIFKSTFGALQFIVLYIKSVDTTSINQSIIFIGPQMSFIKILL